MTENFINVLKNRRSFYSIGNENIVDFKKIEDLVVEAIKHTPSAFNIQSTKVLILFNSHHKKIWEIVASELQKITKPKSFERAKIKIDSFAKGYGTILFFDDTNLTKQLQQNFPLYESNFPIWAEQSNAMVQFAVWNLLCAEGLGVSLQHYNPVIDTAVLKEWNLPNNYKLIAQMPFGNVISNPENKAFDDITTRYKVYK